MWENLKKKLHEACDAAGDVPKGAYLKKDGTNWSCNNCDLNSGAINDKVAPYIDKYVGPKQDRYECGVKGKCSYVKALLTFRLNE